MIDLLALLFMLLIVAKPAYWVVKYLYQKAKSIEGRDFYLMLILAWSKLLWDLVKWRKSDL